VKQIAGMASHQVLDCEHCEGARVHTGEGEKVSCNLYSDGAGRLSRRLERRRQQRERLGRTRGTLEAG
jgi:hypothetical protein